MNEHSIATDAQGSAAAARDRAGSGRAPRRRSDAGTYIAMAALLLLSWQLGRLPMFDPRTDLGYWMGVVGATMMLLLFAYPLRKRWQPLARWGKAKHWFIVHMVLGIVGPVIVLAHSAFKIGSLNAGVALASMLVVAASGVVGRFIYLHTHRGLGGEVENLRSLQARLGLAEDSARGALSFAPAALARLRALQQHAGHQRDAWSEHLWRLSVLPLVALRERRAIRHDLGAAIDALASAQQWDPARRRSRLRRAVRVADDGVAAVLRVAQFAAYTRLFSLWHVLHVPFVFLMVLCAIAHVVAVHAY